VRIASAIASCASAGGQQPADLEERGLHDRVDAPRETRGAGDGVRVDREDPRLPVEQDLLHVRGQVPPDLVGGEGGVEEHRAALAQRTEHVELRQQSELVAGDEVGPVDEVGRLDRGVGEAQVRHGGRPGLLRVVHEVGLHPPVGALGDDLRGVLVGPTVPSDPSPKNTAARSPSRSGSRNDGSTSSDR
jgi:hypothetical protein